MTLIGIVDGNPLDFEYFYERIPPGDPNLLPLYVIYSAFIFYNLPFL